MNIRSLIFGLTLGFAISGAAMGLRPQDATATTSRPAEDSAKPAAIRKLIVATGAAELGKQMMSQIFDGFQKNGISIPDEFRDGFIKRIDMDELTNLTVPIYEKHLDLETIQAMTTFYESPAGRKVIVALPKIMQESMEVGQKWGMRLGQQIIAELEKERAAAEAKEEKNKEKEEK